MEWHLNFEKQTYYDAGKPGITVPVSLRVRNKAVYVDAKLDTGSSLCVFQREFGETLNFEIESGYRTRINTANSFFIAYGHEVTLSVAGYDFDVMVYFAEDFEIKRNVLGRQGFLDRMQIGLIDYFGQLYLSRISDQI